MFSGIESPDRYEKRWITLGKKGQENRPRVEIDDNGTITKGPIALRGENIGRLSENRERMRVKAAHAKAAGKSGRDLTNRQAAALSGDYRTQQYHAARSAANLAGVATADVLEHMQEAYDYLRDEIQQREAIKERARALTGMTAKRIADVENSHRDLSTVDGFDAAARDVAMEHPELGFDPDDSETPSKIWEFIREGRQEVPALHSREVADLAARWITPSKVSSDGIDWSAVPFSRGSSDSPDRYRQDSERWIAAGIGQSISVIQSRLNALF